MNGFSLIGETHKEVVCLLKELPVNVCVVCSRLIPPTVSEEDDDDGDDVQLTLKELLAEFNEKVCCVCLCIMIFKRKIYMLVLVKKSKRNLLIVKCAYSVLQILKVHLKKKKKKPVLVD